mmetsp:Transcript_27025/g.56597  ORF Transcript_27025/g.56597 Transcript_27025/m.56597 type:complete len:247 (-) Transcript_27025:1220-1960(-)
MEVHRCSRCLWLLAVTAACLMVKIRVSPLSDQNNAVDSAESFFASKLLNSHIKGYFGLRSRPSQQGSAVTKEKSTSFLQLQQHRAMGVSFRRTMDIFPSNATAIVHIDPPSLCQEFDEYGVNDCHFPWGTDIHGNYTVRPGSPLGADDYLDGHLKLDGALPYHFRCPICGQDCQLQIPIVGANITIPMAPDCPVADKKHTLHIIGKLWNYSPTDGFITTKIEGNVSLVQGSTDAILVAFRLEGAIR